MRGVRATTNPPTIRSFFVFFLYLSGRCRGTVKTRGDTTKSQRTAARRLVHVRDEGAGNVCASVNRHARQTRKAWGGKRTGAARGTRRPSRRATWARRWPFETCVVFGNVFVLRHRNAEEPSGRLHSVSRAMGRWKPRSIRQKGIKQTAAAVLSFGDHGGFAVERAAAAPARRPAWG